MTTTHGALFAGYDGIGAALETLFPDLDLSWYSEFDDAPSRIMAHNHPGVPNLGDITEIEWATAPRVKVLSGGFPCQDLSLAGRRAGMKSGTRSGLWSYFLTAIDKLRPELVIIENVRGLLSGCAESDLEPCPGCVGYADHRPVLRALGRVLGDLADIGFDAEWAGIEAATVGAPHKRFREFIVAFPADTDGDLFRQFARRALAEEARAHEGHRPADTRGGGRVLTFPTPRASDGDKGGPGQRGSSGDLTLPSAVVRALPTPTASDANSSGGSSESNVTLTDALVGKRPSGMKLFRSPVADEAGGGPLHPDTARERGQTLRLTGQILAMTGDLLPAPSGVGGQGGRMPRSSVHSDEFSVNSSSAGQRFGEYQAAVDRWEPVIGRKAPAPTVANPKSGKPQLSPLFTEWMMGLPLGRVTDPAIWVDSGLSAPAIRNAQLKACGNGVVPQQAAFAIRALILRAHYSLAA